MLCQACCWQNIHMPTSKVALPAWDYSIVAGNAERGRYHQLTGMPMKQIRLSRSMEGRSGGDLPRRRPPPPPAERMVVAVR